MPAACRALRRSVEWRARGRAVVQRVDLAHSGWQFSLMHDPSIPHRAIEVFEPTRATVPERMDPSAHPGGGGSSVCGAKPLRAPPEKPPPTPPPPPPPQSPPPPPPPPPPLGDGRSGRFCRSLPERGEGGVQVARVGSPDLIRCHSGSSRNHLPRRRGGIGRAE